MSLRKVALGAIVAACIYWSPALYHWSATGFGDWQQFLHQWEAARVSYLRYGELPLWNPWHCGGIFLVGDPQAQGFSPFFFLLGIPFGSAAGLKLFMLLHTAVGFGGMYVFARRHLDLNAHGAAMASLVFAGSGFFAWHGSGGHPAFMPFYFAPLLLLVWRAALEKTRFAVAVAAIMALVVFEGGVYPFPYFALLVAMDSLRELRSVDGVARVVRAGMASGALTLLLGAFRFLPILATIRDYPRHTSGSDSLRMDELVAMLTAKEYDYAFPGHEYVWAEYGAFIGWVALGLALVGLLLSLRERRWVVAGALFFGGCTLGAVTPWFPWPVLHSLPVYESLRVPSRFVVLLTFYLALAAGIATRRISVLLQMRRRDDRWGARFGGLALIALVAGHIAWGNAAVIDRWRDGPLSETEDEEGYHITSMNEYGGYASFPARNVSTVGCYTGVTSYSSARGLRPGALDQVRVTRGKLVEDSRTSQTLSAEVEVEQEGATVTWNQTWAPGWVSDAGVVGANPQGLIEVRGLHVGTHRLRLRYAPPEVLPGMLLTLLGLLVSLGVVVLARRKSRQGAVGLARGGASWFNRRSS